MCSVNYAEQQNKLPDFKKRNPEFNMVYSKTIQSMLEKLDGSLFLGVHQSDREG